MLIMSLNYFFYDVIFFFLNSSDVELSIYIDPLILSFILFWHLLSFLLFSERIFQPFWLFYQVFHEYNICSYFFDYFEDNWVWVIVFSLFHGLSFKLMSLFLYFEIGGLQNYIGGLFKYLVILDCSNLWLGHQLMIRRSTWGGGKWVLNVDSF